MNMQRLRDLLREADPAGPAAGDDEAERMTTAAVIFNAAVTIHVHGSGQAFAISTPPLPRARRRRIVGRTGRAD